MAFLSLGLDREVPQDVAEAKLHVVEKPEANSSENYPANPSQQSVAVTPEKNEDSKKTVVMPPISSLSTNPVKDHANGNGNGNGAKTAAEETKAQSKPPAPLDNTAEVKASESEDDTEDLSATETLGLPPEIEQLRKQISEGMRPAFRSDAHSSPELSSLMEELQEKLAAEAKDDQAAEPSAPVSTVAPEVLSPVMDEIRQKLAKDAATLPELDQLVQERARTPVPPQNTSYPQRASSNQRTWMGTPIQPAVPPQPKTVVAHPDADGTPTFATFKFGYLPGKGLLYSVIGHEVLMFGLFLLITYVVPSFREE